MFNFLLVGLTTALMNVILSLLFGVTAQVAVLSTTYFMMPAIVLSLASSKKNRPTIADAIAFLWMALVLIVMGKRFGGTVNLPYITFLAISEAVALWKYCRGMTGITFLKRPSNKDLLWSLEALVLMWVILLPLALIIGFPKPNQAFAADHSLANIFSLTIAGLTKPGFVGDWVRKILITALIEELAFRGLVLNLLEKRFGPNVALWVSSFLFGLSHIGHGGWHYVFLSGLAGLGFGNVYQKTRCLSWSMTVHGAFDTLARLLFVF